jgi:hypothetical protein
MTRRALCCTLAALVAALVTAASAAAYWSAAGTGRGVASTGSVATVAEVDTTLHGTIAATSVDIVWTPIAVTAGVVPEYSVERYAGAAKAIVCTTTATGCPVSGSPDALTTYTVTAAVGSWTGGESVHSTALRVSTAAPTLTAKPPAQTTDPTAAFAFTQPYYTSFRCSLDGAAFATCTSPVSYSGLAVGTHTFRVGAVDGYGVATAVTTSTWSRS